MSLSVMQMVATARADVREVAPVEASDALGRDEIKLVVDVREPDEFKEAHLPDAVNVPRGLLEIRADPASPAKDPVLTSDPSARILVYCTKAPSARSLLAAQTLASMGYGHVEALEGGLNAWAEASLPVDRERVDS
jgi:rhodanese-related sulfurtransferase